MSVRDDDAVSASERPRSPGHGAVDAPRTAVNAGAARVAAIALVVVLGVIGLASPSSVLAGGLAWLGFVLAALSGWGYLVARVARAGDPDLGLRIAWGVAGVLAVAGPLVAIGVASRPVLLVALGVGVAGFGWRELTAETASCVAAWRGVRHVRANPALGTLAIVLGAVAVLQIAGGVAALDRNPWDDDIAYTPLVKRLLDTGDLVEPFSFRRLSAYGGQTVLAALAGARGTLANVHLVDKGLGFAIALLLLVGFARERQTRPLWVTTIALVVLLLPETAINTAPQWTGVALFVALYRTVLRERWVLVGVVGAAACTLRQNYIAVVGLFVAGTLLVRLLAARRASGWAAAWAAEQRRWLVTAGAALAVIVPWWFAAYASSQTFLYPIFEGTWTHGLTLGPAASSWADELAYLAWACIETSPVTVVPVLFAVLAFTTDRRPGRPLRVLFVATTLGFLLLVYAFPGSAPPHLWRYAFGFGLALAIVLAIEIGATDDAGDGADDAGDAAVRLVPLGRWLLLAALVLQIVVNRDPLPKRFAGLLHDLREAAVIGRHGDPTAQAERRRYAAMQAAIPAGARVVVMLDDPAYLDFDRNPIANLDTPGFASPGPQLPSFEGPEAMRAYLAGQGYRYLAFVRSERSRYFYRRAFWLWRLFNDGELFAAMSAYAIDAIDTFAALATTERVAYDADGLVVVDLGTATTTSPARDADEARRRHAWVRALADREGLHDAWSLTTRDDLRFEDGVGSLAFVDGGIDDPAWFEIARPRPEGTLRGQAVRPLHRRAHLRVRGASAMRLVVRAAISLHTTLTRPRIDVSLDGELVTSAIADDRGRYEIELVVPAGKLAGGWHDLYLVSSSIAEPDKAQRDLRVARLELVEWTPAR